jgi:hypothetical protein
VHPGLSRTGAGDGPRAPSRASGQTGSGKAAKTRRRHR